MVLSRSTIILLAVAAVTIFVIQGVNSSALHKGNTALILQDSAVRERRQSGSSFVTCKRNCVRAVFNYLRGLSGLSRITRTKVVFGMFYPRCIRGCKVCNPACDSNAACTNGECSCNDGFVGDGLTCTDIDECATNNGGCDTNADCANTPGSFTCTCQAGYTEDGMTCSNIDECATASSSCDVNADCMDTEGSFTCTCQTGYTGDGMTCTALQPGQVLSNPAVSCLAILEANPNAISDYYWLRPADAPSDQQPSQFFCDMTFDCDGSGAVGGWMRIANFQPSIDGNCPSDYTFETETFGDSCSVLLITSSCHPSNSFSVGGIEYSQVCGKAVGHVAYNPFAGAYPAFTNEATDTIDDPYVTGLSLTYGTPQMHIWSFAASDTELNQVCPCVSGDTPPTFVGPDYFCEGTESFNTPLWDGLDCSAEDVCSCTTNGPPYFNRILDSPTTEDIALRSCVVADDRSRISFTSLEIYVR